jgi:membrane protein implicated in regulation of membrane protease activity
MATAMLAAVTIATAIFLIAVGAILRYAINVHSDVINIQTVGLILMIAGGAGLAISLLYELVQQGGDSKDDEYPQRRGGYDDPTRRM